MIEYLIITCALVMASIYLYTIIRRNLKSRCIECNPYQCQECPYIQTIKCTCQKFPSEVKIGAILKESVNKNGTIIQ